MSDRSQSISDVEAMAGGLSVPPANAVTDRAHTSTPARTRLSMVLSPFFNDGRRIHGTTLIVTANRCTTSVRFTALLEEDPSKALAYADGMLSAAVSQTEFVRWAINTALAQRYLHDFRGSRRTHTLAAPTVALVDDSRLVGLHYHGKGFTHLELGEWDAALGDFREARKVFVSASMWDMVASTDNNTGLLYVRAGLPGEAHPFIDRAIDRWLSLGMEEMAARGLDTRARAYEAQGRIAEARLSAVESVNILESTGNLSAIEESKRTARGLLL